MIVGAQPVAPECERSAGLARPGGTHGIPGAKAPGYYHGVVEAAGNDRLV
jgi:hypothetical protein